MRLIIVQSCQQSEGNVDHSVFLLLAKCTFHLDNFAFASSILTKAGFLMLKEDKTRLGLCSVIILTLVTFA